MNAQSELLSLSFRLMEKMIFNTPSLRQLYMTAKGEDKSEYGYWHSDGALQIHELMQKLGKKKIIDLGSGLGLLMAQLQCLGGYYARGIDNESLLVQSALVSTKCKDLLQLQKKDIKEFEVLYMWEPIRHEDKAKKFVETLVKSVSKHQIIIYRSAGHIGRFLQESNKFIHHPKLNYRINGDNVWSKFRVNDSQFDVYLTK